MTILSQTIAIPIWAVLVAIAAIVALGVLIRGLEIRRQLAVVGGIAALLIAMSSAIISSQHVATPQRQHVAVAIPVAPDAERNALEARQAELTARAANPGSPLACLDALSGVSVESGCEQAIFASPISAAVAVSYATARLQLLADGIAFARRADPSYESKLVDLRRTVQNDAYGIYAHILATRDGCTPERCAAFALLGDPSTLKVHLRQGVYASYLAQYRDRWATASAGLLTAPPQPPSSAAATATMALAATDLAVPVTTATIPLPKTRPAPSDVAGPNALAAVPPAADAPSAAVERRSASLNRPPALSRGLVPPVASVVPNLDYPSSSSIPPINIMAAEPKLPPASAAPDKPSPKPSTAQKPSSRPQ
jgi:hypothetical protein